MQKSNVAKLARICRLPFYAFLVINISLSPLYPAIQIHAANYGALIQLPDFSNVPHNLTKLVQDLFASITASQNGDHPDRLQATTPTATNTATTTATQPANCTSEEPVYLVGGGHPAQIAYTCNFSSSSPNWHNITPVGISTINDFTLDPTDPYHNAIAVGTESGGGPGVWLSTNLNQVSPTWTEVLTSGQIATLYNQLIAYRETIVNGQPIYSPLPVPSLPNTVTYCGVTNIVSVSFDPSQNHHVRVTPETNGVTWPSPYQCPTLIFDSTDAGLSWNAVPFSCNFFTGTSTDNCTEEGTATFSRDGTFFELARPNPGLTDQRMILLPSQQVVDLNIWNEWFHGSSIATVDNNVFISYRDFTPGGAGGVNLAESSGGGWSHVSVSDSNLQNIGVTSFYRSLKSFIGADGNSYVYVSVGANNQALGAYGEYLFSSVNNGQWSSVMSTATFSGLPNPSAYAVNPKNINNILTVAINSGTGNICWSWNNNTNSWDNKTGDWYNVFSPQSVWSGGTVDFGDGSIGNVFITGPSFVQWQTPPPPPPSATPTAIPTLQPTSTPGGITSTPASSGVVLSANAVAGNTSNASDMDADGEQQAHPSVGGPIDPITGNYSYAATDFNLPASGGELAFRHSYSVARLEWPDEGMGAGWTDNFNIRLFIPGIKANGFDQSASDNSTPRYTLQESNGSRQYFTSLTDGSFYPEAGFFASMVRTGSSPNYTYTVLLRNLTRYQFNNNGQLVQLDHLAGPNMTNGWNPLVFTYGSGSSFPTYDALCSATGIVGDTNPTDLQGLLLQVTDTPSLPTNSYNIGKASTLSLCYDTTTPTHHLIAVVLQNGTTYGNTPTIHFAYTNGELSSFTDLHGKTWSYAYTQTVGVPPSIQSELLTRINDPLLPNDVVEAETYFADTGCNTSVPVLGPPTSQQTIPCMKVSQQTHGNGSEQTTIASFNYTDGSNTVVTDGNGNQAVYNFRNTDPYTGVSYTGTGFSFSETVSHDPSTFLPGSVTYNGIMSTLGQDGLHHYLNSVTYPGTATRPGIRVTDQRASTNFVTYSNNGFSYDLPSIVTDAAGNTTSYTYPQLGVQSGRGVDNFPTLPITIIRTDILTGIPATYNLYYYASTGWLEMEQDPLGHNTFFTYNASGQISQKISNYTGNYNPNADPTLPVGFLYRDGAGNVHPQNVATEYFYDALGRITDTIDLQTGRDDNVNYDDGNYKVTIALNKYASGSTPAVTTTDYFDFAGRLIKTVDADQYDTIYSYDSGGRLTQVQRKTNSSHYATTTYTYDAADNVSSTSVSMTPQPPMVTVTCYDGLKRPVTTLQNASFIPAKFAIETTSSNYCQGIALSSSGANIPTNTTYDPGTGKPFVVTNPFYSLTYAYDALGRTASVTQAAGTAGTIVNATPMPASEQWKYDYDMLGNINQITDPAGSVTWRCYNLDSQLVYQIQNAGSGNAPTCTVTSTQLPTLSQITPPSSIFTATPGTNYPTNLTTFTAYDKLGRATDSWDPLGRHTSTAYDEIGRVLNQTVNTTGANFDPAAPDRNLKQSMSYTLASGVETLQITDYVGRVTLITYDVLGRQQAITVNKSGTTAPDQNITTAFQYDGRGHVVGQSDPSLNPTPVFSGNVLTGAQTTFLYDGLGRLTQVTDPANVSTTTSFDDAGNILSVVGPDTPATQFNYDHLSRLTSTQIIGTQLVTGSSDYSQYFTAKPAVTASDGQGTKTRYSYDAFARLISTIQNYRGGSVNVYTVGGANDTDLQTLYTYDVLNRLSTVQLPNGSGGLRTYKYDAASRVNEVDQANTNGTYTSSNWLMNYDPVGRQLQVTDPSQKTRQTAYNNADDVLGTTYSQNPADNANFNYSYTGENKTVTMASGGVTATLGYDALGQLVSYASGASNTSNVTFAYNADGQRTGTTIGTGSSARTITYAYCGTNGCPAGTSAGTSADALASVQLGGAWSTSGTVSYSYNQGHQLKSMSLPNGVTETLGYDGNNRLTSIEYKKGSQSLFKVVYTLDNDGNRRIAHEDLQGAVATVCPNTTATATITATATATATGSATATNTPSPSATPTLAVTYTPTPSPTATQTGTPPGTQVYSECHSPATVTPTSTNTNTPTNTPSPTNTPIPPRIDTVGLFRASSGSFYLRLHNTTGNADITVSFHPGTTPYPVVGDWTGAGFDAVGVFDKSNGLFTLCTSNSTTNCASTSNQIQFTLGSPNDVPLAGRWLPTATHAGVGVFRPSNGIIYLKNVLTTGYADYSMVFGIPGDSALAGDWTGKNFDSPGVYRPSNTTFYLSNVVTNGSVYADITFAYSSGTSTDIPLAGDWTALGHDGVGTFTTAASFRLKNVLTAGAADNTFAFGIANDIPIAGHWQVTYPPIVNPPGVLIPASATPSASLTPQPTEPSAPTFMPATRIGLLPPVNNQSAPVLYQPAPQALYTGPTSTPTASLTATPSASPTPAATLVPLDRVITYGYDGVYRLTGARYVDNGAASYNFAYGYDLNGNRTSASQTNTAYPTLAATYSYSGANQVIGSTINGTPYNYQYDARGNLTVVSTGGTWTANYNYDSADRLNQANAGSLHTSYTYDGFDNRISQTIGSVTTNYLVDPSGSLPQLLGEFPTTGSPTFYLPGMGQDSGGRMGYFAQDGLDSVRQMTDSSGNLTYAANFDPYGGILNANGLSGKTSLGYTGAPSDPSGLVYLNARFYNPSIGSFLTHDPLEGDPSSPMSFNGYAYAGSNPTTYTDPSGKCFDPISFFVCALVAGAIAGVGTDAAVQVAGIAANHQALSSFDWGQALHFGGQGAEIGAIGGTIGVGISLLGPAATWLAANQVVEGGLIGGEAEWLRQFSINSANGMSALQAGNPNNMDYWEIAKSATFAAITGGVWKAAGVFSDSADLGFFKMTSSIPAATFWGGILSSTSYFGILGAINFSQGKDIRTGFTWDDFFSNAATGSIINWLTAGIGGSIENTRGWGQLARNANVDNFFKVFPYIGVGVGVSAAQLAINSGFDYVDHGHLTSNLTCTSTFAMAAGMGNFFSLIQNPVGYAAMSLGIGITSGIRATSCSVPKKP